MEGKSDWMKVKHTDVEKIVLELHEQGFAPAKIGLVLRDQHGIPKAKLVGKNIIQILKDAHRSYVTEKNILEQNMKRLGTHIAKHKHDTAARRSIMKKLWSLKKLS